jgi:dolichol-phosphate mannosyltransferase
MKLSIIIPAHNEQDCIAKTVADLYAALAPESIDHEILVVNDNSSDGTKAVVLALEETVPSLRLVDNPAPNGFGSAVRRGLENYTGDAVAIYMADASDRPEDLVSFFRAMQDKGVECVFGSRFIRGGRTIEYPAFKLVLNRLANTFIRVLFGLQYNDITNAFKLYRKDVIEGLKPFLSQHFNITVEIPLKAIVRGYSYAIVPNYWINRKTGVSKLKVQEMGSRYLFIVLYCFIERWLSKGDYHRRNHVPTAYETVGSGTKNLESTEL